MYLRRCLQEVRMQLGESDLILRGDGWDAATRETEGRLPQSGSEPALAREDNHRPASPRERSRRQGWVAGDRLPGQPSSWM
jgi:hypothetical protein